MFRGESDRNKATLYSNELVWNITSKIVDARGNVIYSQIDPELNLTGYKALGKLDDNSIVVTGNNGKRVVTNIIP